MLNCSSVGCLIFKAEKKFETPGRRYMNSSHSEIGSGGYCMDTKKNAEQVKKRQDFDWFLLVTCCCLTLMYDRLKYLELYEFIIIITITFLKSQNYSAN